jgi:hypothetical protein
MVPPSPWRLKNPPLEVAEDERLIACNFPIAAPPQPSREINDVAATNAAKPVKRFT